VKEPNSITTGPSAATSIRLKGSLSSVKRVKSGAVGKTEFRASDHGSLPFVVGWDPTSVLPTFPVKRVGNPQNALTGGDR